MDRHGQTQKRTQNDPNEIIEYPLENYAEILLYKKQGINWIEVARAKVDLEDVEACKQYHWGLSNGYAYAWIYDKKVYLHQFVMGNRDGSLQVHHKNYSLVKGRKVFDTLDNRKRNLEIKTRSLHHKEKSVYSNNTSNIIGVHYLENENLYMAYINVDGKRITLERYKNIDDAIKARLKAEIEYSVTSQDHLWARYGLNPDEIEKKQVSMPWYYSIKNAVESENNKTEKKGFASDLTLEQYIQAMLFFEVKCPFCGKPLDRDIHVIGHVKNVKHGGGTTKTNIIPCCTRCNNSRSVTPDWKAWYHEQEFYKKEREQTIDDYFANIDLYVDDRVVYFEIVKNSRKVYFKAVDRNGVEYFGDNQEKFSKEHGMSQAGISGVMLGKWSKHKGYSIYPLTDEEIVSYIENQQGKVVRNLPEVFC